jgi:hypothetical protein
MRTKKRNGSTRGGAGMTCRARTRSCGSPLPPPLSRVPRHSPHPSARPPDAPARCADASRSGLRGPRLMGRRKQVRARTLELARARQVQKAMDALLKVQPLFLSSSWCPGPFLCEGHPVGVPTIVPIVFLCDAGIHPPLASCGHFRVLRRALAGGESAAGNCALFGRAPSLWAGRSVGSGRGGGRGRSAERAPRCG